MLYFTREGCRHLANQNRGHIRVMLEFVLYYALQKNMNKNLTKRVYTRLYIYNFTCKYFIQNGLICICR